MSRTTPVALLIPSSAHARKPCAMIMEQILNTSNMEIIHHLVLATNHFCVMYKINIKPSFCLSCVCMCALPSYFVLNVWLVNLPARATQAEGRQERLACGAASLHDDHQV